jgi:signal transduction histidine kinase
MRSIFSAIAGAGVLGDEAWIAVRDGGPGIEPAMRTAVLQPFAVGTQAGGVGLGLAVVERIARLHGGEVRMSSGPEGFEVRVVWPRG